MAARTDILQAASKDPSTVGYSAEMMVEKMAENWGKRKAGSTDGDVVVKKAAVTAVLTDTLILGLTGWKMVAWMVDLRAVVLVGMWVG